jgi:hypothetical protein
MAKTQDDIPRSANLLKTFIINSPGLLNPQNPKAHEKIEQFAKEATEFYATSAFIADRILYRLVVIFLGSIASLSICGALYLSIISTKDVVQIPDVITALGSAAIGALAGLLAPSPVGK